MPNTVDQVYTLNNLLAMLAGSERGFTQELRRSIRFAAQNLSGGSRLASLTQCARELLKLHWQGRRPASLLHCDLAGETHEPLWLRSRVLETLKSAQPRQDVVLLVSGLRDSVAAQGRRWTRRRESEYAAARDYLEDLCARERPFGVRLNVIFI